MIHPLMFPIILGIAGLFLVFSPRLSVSSSRELRRPSIIYVGLMFIAIAFLLWFILGWVKLTVQLMWSMPAGFIVAILIMVIFSVKKEEPFIMREDEIMDTGIRMLTSIFLLMFTWVVFVFTVIMSPVVAAIILVPLIALTVKVIRKKKK